MAWLCALSLCVLQYVFISRRFTSSIKYLLYIFQFVYWLMCNPTSGENFECANLLSSKFNVVVQLPNINLRETYFLQRGVQMQDYLVFRHGCYLRQFSTPLILQTRASPPLISFPDNFLHHYPEQKHKFHWRSV